VYNIGGNSETANIDIVRILCGLVDDHLTARPELQAAFPGTPAAVGKRSEQLITYVRDRPGHDRRYAIDYRKAERELGYTPGRKLAQGLEETLRWYLGNTGWWQALLGRDYSEWIERNYRRP
jgi:dTDP-glucose 4,6-dehydratase